MDQKKMGIMLVVMVIILFSIVLYFVIARSTEKQLVGQTPLENQKHVKPSSVTPDVQSYIEVKELGFKIPVDKLSAREITYKIVPGEKDNPNPSVYFSTKALNAMSKECENGSAGAIVKISGRATTDPNDENFIPGEIKQFSDFFLVLQSPQAPCHEGDNSVDRAFIQIIENGFKNTVLINK